MVESLLGTTFSFWLSSSFTQNLPNVWVYQSEIPTYRFSGSITKVFSRDRGPFQVNFPAKTIQDHQRSTKSGNIPAYMRSISGHPVPQLGTDYPGRYSGALSCIAYAFADFVPNSGKRFPIQAKNTKLDCLLRFRFLHLYFYLIVEDNFRVI